MEPMIVDHDRNHNLNDELRGAILKGMSQATPAQLLERITSDPRICGGKPCIRGMRIRVTDVLDLLVADLTPAQIVIELPDLELDDVRAAIAFAARSVNHAVLAA